MQKIVSHTPIEVEHLEALQSGLDGPMRSAIFPSEQNDFSWWSYRSADWRLSNRGLRLDHIWVTAPLKPALSASHVTDARDWPHVGSCAGERNAQSLGRSAAEKSCRWICQQAAAKIFRPVRSSVDPK